MTETTEAREDLYWLTVQRVQFIIAKQAGWYEWLCPPKQASVVELLMQPPDHKAETTLSVGLGYNFQKPTPSDPTPPTTADFPLPPKKQY